LRAVSASLRAVPSHRGHPAALWLRPAGDAPSLLPGFQLYGLLAADQYLLERLHAEALLLPRLLPRAQAGNQARPCPGDALCLFPDLVFSRLPVVLAARLLPDLHAGHPVLGHPGRAGHYQLALGDTAWAAAHARQTL